MAKDTADTKTVDPFPVNMYKITYAYANEKGQMRNGAIVVKATNPDDAKKIADTTLSQEYDSHRIGSVKIW